MRHGQGTGCTAMNDMDTLTSSWNLHSGGRQTLSKSLWITKLNNQEQCRGPREHTNSCWWHSVPKSCLTLCIPTPGFPVLRYIAEFAQTHVHWVGDTIQPSHLLWHPSPPQSSRASGSFPVSQLFVSGGQSTGASASASALPINIWGWFPLGLPNWSPCCPKDSQESSPALQFESINSLVLSLLYCPTLTSIQDYWKNSNFDCMDLCWQSDISAFRYAVWVCHSFPSKERLLISWLHDRLT